MNRLAGYSLALFILLSLNACVTTSVDEMVFNEPSEGIGDSSVVILGRRHASDYDTEPQFVACVGKYIRSKDKTINVIDEPMFLDALYPWFEPRTAPLHAPDLQKLFENQNVQDKLAELKLEYMIWLDGSTIRSDSAGSMACGVGPGGGGCFGFGTWSNDSKYEAAIWNFTDNAEVGRISAEATGRSYMPALIVPIPILAPVQGTACEGIAEQLLEFLSGKY